MENMPPPSDTVIKIDRSCLNQVHDELDTESSFKYWNMQFFISACVMILLFSVQVYYGLPDGKEVDMTNFTYRFSNYREWWNPFGILIWMFLHGWLSHLLSNLIFLYPFTLITSSVLKHSIFISVIMITGLIAGEASNILNDIPSLWASWWIFWIFWFLTPYFLYNKKNLSSNVQDFPWVFLFMAVYMVWQGISDLYIDNIAHIVWFISGICYGFVYFRYYHQTK